MPKTKKTTQSVFLALAICIAVLAFANVLPAGAQSCPAAQEGLPGDFMSFTRSIVPCSRSCDVSSTDFDETAPCTLCHLIVMVHNIYTLMLAMLIIVSLFFITMGGVLFIVSAGNPDLRSRAKNVIKKTLLGFALFLLTWMIVYWLLVFISADESQLGLRTGDGDWYKFECEGTSEF